ncbi:MAG: hypothetical protein IPH78_09970 [Bacteroidetes bacterium]|nr:hypothetical protein [Bacteroidota bacterium]
MIKLEKPSLLFSGQKKYAHHTDIYAAGFDKYKVVLVYNLAGDTLPDAVRSMLNKLIAACKVNENEVFFINNHNRHLSLSDIHLLYKPSYVLLFGDTGVEKNLTAMKLNMDYELYGLSVLKTLSPDKLISSDKDKAALWKALQSLFKLTPAVQR